MMDDAMTDAAEGHHDEKHGLRYSDNANVARSVFKLQSQGRRTQLAQRE
jgi:hypothetical protein